MQIDLIHSRSDAQSCSQRRSNLRTLNIRRLTCQIVPNAALERSDCNGAIGLQVTQIDTDTGYVSNGTTTGFGER